MDETTLDTFQPSCDVQGGERDSHDGEKRHVAVKQRTETKNTTAKKLWDYQEQKKAELD